MIPRAAITEWTQFAPWKNMHQVEQDLIICRALQAIFSDKILSTKLAFRGGTALHKLFLSPQKRYSEDIDLVQITSGPIGVILDKIKEVLFFLEIHKIKQKENNNSLIFTFPTTFLPETVMKLKVEINCQEHFSMFEPLLAPFEIKNQWYSGNCLIQTYCFNELIGTKLRALYQRKKGRDLFDLYCAIKSGLLDVDSCIICYKKYMEYAYNKIPSAKEYLTNLEDKIRDGSFRQDIVPIIGSDVVYDVDTAFSAIKTYFVSKM
ncbi:MAG: nucleotidyl transferase AbiEii/AbiGii toxin family protein [Deltaproteobacteria bacterium]|jgi:predicted nucleotidyltransferase component of viral defense system|nr:nucleotidyl transferase AbiEii/AbiGii toxin family protein [Deltaproteobacteria bacterium]